MILKDGDGNTGVQPNKAEAARNFKLAADQGNVDAMVKYSLMRHNGTGIINDKEEAVHYIKKAVEKDDPEAMYYYGTMLEERSSSGEISTDKKEAAHYYQLAADKGDTRAMVKYGEKLYNGDGVDKNIEDAANYFKMAAEIQKQKNFTILSFISMKFP